MVVSSTERVVWEPKKEVAPSEIAAKLLAETPRYESCHSEGEGRGAAIRVPRGQGEGPQRADPLTPRPCFRNVPRVSSVDRHVT